MLLPLCVFVCLCVCSWVKVDPSIFPASSSSGEELPPAAAAAAPVTGARPCERMAHSLTVLPGHRVLLVGGRRKEGICTVREANRLQTVGAALVRGGRQLGRRSPNRAGLSVAPV